MYAGGNVSIHRWVDPVPAGYVQLRREPLAEREIYEVLSNERRREALRDLTAAGGSIELTELATTVAERETGESPPPRSARESVYNALHQTHLPKLEELRIVDYDRESRTVRLRRPARQVDLYMEVVTRYGLAWSEIYRALGIAALSAVLGSLLELPGISLVDPLLVTSLSLAAFAVASTYHLWTNRWIVLSELRSESD